MKLAIETKRLLQALESVSKAIPDRPTHPILSYARFVNPVAGKLILTGFDLSMGIQVGLDVDGESGGSIALPSKLLLEIVKRLPDGELVISTDDNNATITSSSGEYQIRGLSTEEYPELPAINNGESLAIDPDQLLMGAKSLNFASADETKQILTGVHLKILSDNLGINSLEFATTDGHRIFLIESLIDGKIIEPDAEQKLVSLTVPARAFREVERMLVGRKGGEDENVLIEYSDAQITFSYAGQKVLCRILDGFYPAYRQLLPTSSSCEITLDRRGLIGSLERVRILAKQGNDIVKCNVDHDNQTITLSAESADVGSASESLPSQISSDGVNALAFNVKYLIEGLKTFDTTEVMFRLNSAKEPILVLPLGGDKMTYLIMPVQLRS